MSQRSHDSRGGPIRSATRGQAGDAHLLGLLADAPLGVQLVGGNSRLLAAVHGIVDVAVLERGRPGETELSLELVSWDVELGRFEDGSFGGDSVVVLVNEFLLVNHLGRDGSLGEDFDSLGLEAGLDALLDGISDSVGLDENEGL